MSELKYSGFTVSVVLGLIVAIMMENIYLILAGVVVGILYEIINK